jgi:hypothetical protein
MKLRIERVSYLETCTIGELSIDGERVGIYTLEDKFRQISGRPVSDWKVFGETAVPTGSYAVIVDHSDHFGKDLPHILDVPGFEGVRIHPGNSDKDTEGCILVGLDWSGGDFIGRSREAFEILFEKITRALSLAESIQIDVG